MILFVVKADGVLDDQVHKEMMFVKGTVPIASNVNVSSSKIYFLQLETVRGEGLNKPFPSLCSISHFTPRVGPHAWCMKACFFDN